MKELIVLAGLFSTALWSFAAHAGATLPHRDPSPVALAGKAPDKDKHEHKKGEKEEEHKGEKKDLGKQKIGSFNVQVVQIGDVKPGAESIFIITPKGEGEPKAIRAWVGIESGQGSIRTAAEEEKEGEWHAHHQVSKPMPPKSKLWVELETAAGKQKASFALK